MCVVMKVSLLYWAAPGPSLRRPQYTYTHYYTHTHITTHITTQLKGKVDALTKELQTANEAWDTKWNQENWAKQVPKP